MNILIYTREKKNLSEELQEYLVENFDGLYIECIAPESVELGKRFHPFDCLLDTGTSTWRNSIKLCPEILNKYIDEPISSKDIDKWNVFDVEKQIDLFDYNLTIGELSSRAFDILETYTCCITFTAYRRYIKWIERLTGWRIYLPFTSPLSHWIDLENKFKHNFNMVWIHLTKNKKDIRKLIDWADEKRKQIWIYAGIDTWETEEELIKYLENFKGE